MNSILYILIFYTSFRYSKEMACQTKYALSVLKNSAVLTSSNSNVSALTLNYVETMFLHQVTIYCNKLFK